jgi:hypothetical protein
MDLTLIGRALRRNWLFVVAGVMVAVLAGLLAGYSVSSSGLEPRTPPSYRGTATIMLSDPSVSVYAAQLGGDVPADAAAVAESANLSQLAMIYAWVVSGDEIRDSAQDIVGSFGGGENLTAQRRTTQPTGSEEFGSNSALPIFDVIATAQDGDRATEIAEGATDVFLQYVEERQEAAGIPADERVNVTVLRSASSTMTDGGSSVSSSVLVGVVVLLVVFLLAVYRTHAAEIRAGRAVGPRRRESRPAPSGAVRPEVLGGSDDDGPDAWSRSTPVLASRAAE